jgi:hypothetical protein
MYVCMCIYMKSIVHTVLQLLLPRDPVSGPHGPHSSTLPGVRHRRALTANMMHQRFRWVGNESISHSLHEAALLFGYQLLLENALLANLLKSQVNCRPHYESRRCQVLLESMIIVVAVYPVTPADIPPLSLRLSRHY